MKIKTLVGAVLGVIATLTTGLAGATVYNATSDFSLTNNPTGVWSYGWMPADFSSFNLYPDTRIETAALGGSTVWYDTALGTEPNLWRNDTLNTYFNVLPGQLAMHPGGNGQAAVLRFTAPSAGTAAVDWEFFAGDFGSPTVGVRDGSAFLWSASNSGASSLTTVFTPGSTLDFLIYGGYFGGNTPLAASVNFTTSGTTGGNNGIPEPATMALMGLGLAGLAFRKRKTG